jgi:HEPN domain-containing protein
MNEESKAEETNKGQMTKEDHIKYWIELSDDNFKSMLNMFKSKEYMWSLFVGHLALEKLLKAYYVKVKDKKIPFIHDLYKLALKCELGLNESQKDSLQYITLFNVQTRYEDYKRDFYKKCTKEFAEKNMERIKELRNWLKEKIGKQYTG